MISITNLAVDIKIVCMSYCRKDGHYLLYLFKIPLGAINWGEYNIVYI